AMLVASTLAGLSLEEGDRLRKAIKKSSTKEKLIEVSRYFLTKAAENGIARDVAQDVWTQMAKFTEYSFCRAHAAGYGLVAYQAAYLKAHHPADYMVAALNNLQGIYPTRVHLWEAKRMGIEVLPPCVNHSESEFALEQGRIRIGLSYIKGLATRTIEAILKQREKEPFRALRGFLSRVSISLAELENLIVVGGFDFMGLPRPQLIWLARAMIGKIKSARGSDGMLCGVPDGIPMPSLEDYSIAQKVNYELQVLECPVSAHPVALARSSCGNDITRGVDLPQFVGKRVRLLGIIDTMRSTPTRNGETMEFLTMEDETGIFEVTLFPRTYRRFRSILGDYGPYLVEGTAQSQYGSLSVTAKTIARFRAKQ
ncbi:MAG: hypothetical protein QGD94_03610, partial [Planctomycetia bacterium]|nr:hypothetical protein [Planctomycetia bacterium]